MLPSLYVMANLAQLVAGACFTADSWSSVRYLVEDIINTPSLTACQEACLQNDQCAAASYSTSSTCALLGEDTGKAFKCPSPGTLYVRDPACEAATTSTSTSTSTVTTSTSTAATTTTLGIDKECANTCLIQVTRESSVDPVMIVDTWPMCMISCPSGSMTARGADGIWFDVPSNVLACYGDVYHNPATDLKWCSPTTPYVGYLDPDNWITIVVQCSGSTVVPPVRINTSTCPIIADNPACATPAFTDPGCNTQLHKCTMPTRNGDKVECPTGAGGLFVTATGNATSGPLECVEGKWWDGDNSYTADTAVYCKTCADVHFGASSGYNPDGVTPVRSADGLSYTCPSPYGVWLAYHPADVPGTYYLRRTTAFKCAAPDYLWDTPGADQGPQPTAMIADWITRGEAYDVGCSNNAEFGWGACPLPKWVDPGCDGRLHTCSAVAVAGNYLQCPTGYGIILTATNTAPSCIWVCTNNQWTACGTPVAPATAVYCKTCADPEINWNGFTAAGVVPARSADGLNYACPAPYTRVTLAYVPAGTSNMYMRNTTRFLCFQSTYEWNSPGSDNGPMPLAMVKDFVTNGDEYNIGCDG